MLGADIELVRKGMGSDARIGPKFLFAGPGFGGSCFPKDLRAAISTGARGRLQAGDPRRGASPSTSGRSGASARRSSPTSAATCKGKRIAVWGLAFKPGTDDIREAPALVLIDQLLAAGAKVSAHRSGGASRPCASSSATASSTTSANYDVRQGRRRAGAGHRVARVPPPDLRAPEVAACASRCSSTAATSGAPPSCAPPASPTTAWAAVRHGARRWRRLAPPDQLVSRSATSDRAKALRAPGDRQATSADAAGSRVARRGTRGRRQLAPMAAASTPGASVGRRGRDVARVGGLVAARDDRRRDRDRGAARRPGRPTRAASRTPARRARRAARADQHREAQRQLAAARP